MQTKRPSRSRIGWRALFPLLSRLKLARWVGDAGRKASQALAEWVAPELPDIEDLMKAVEAEELAAGGKAEPLTLEAIRGFVAGAEVKNG